MHTDFAGMLERISSYIDVGQVIEQTGAAFHRAGDGQWVGVAGDDISRAPTLREAACQIVAMRCMRDRHNAG